MTIVGSVPLDTFLALLPRLGVGFEERLTECDPTRVLVKYYSKRIYLFLTFFFILAR